MTKFMMSLISCGVSYDVSFVMEIPLGETFKDKIYFPISVCGSFEDLLRALHYIFQCAAQSIVVVSCDACAVSLNV